MNIVGSAWIKVRLLSRGFRRAEWCITLADSLRRYSVPRGSTRKWAREAWICDGVAASRALRSPVPLSEKVDGYAAHID